MKIKDKLIWVILWGVFANAVFISCNTSSDNYWPQFRGTDGSNVIDNKRLPTEWGDSLNVRWKQEAIGDGLSSPIIVGNKIFYTTSVLEKEAPKTQEAEVPKSDSGKTLPPSPQEEDSYKEETYSLILICLDLKTGKELWRATPYEGAPKRPKHKASSYACETPVSDGKNIFVYYGMHGAYCYDLTGKLIWKNELEALPTRHDWGTGASPVVYNNMLYILMDNEEKSYIIALNAQTGKEKWKQSRDEKTNYSTPVIWKNSIRTELVTGGVTARSYNPDNGELFWEMKIGKEMSIPSPVFDDEEIYIGNTGDPQNPGNIFAIKAGASGDISLPEGSLSSEFILWADTAIGIGNPSPVLYNGLLYLLGGRGELLCVDANTGKLCYKEKIAQVAGCWATPWINGEVLYFFDEKGKFHSIQTGCEFKEIGAFSLEGKFWASVAVANDAYIIKGINNIYCIGD